MTILGRGKNTLFCEPGSWGKRGGVSYLEHRVKLHGIRDSSLVYPYSVMQLRPATNASHSSGSSQPHLPPGHLSHVALLSPPDSQTREVCEHTGRIPCWQRVAAQAHSPNVYAVIMHHLPHAGSEKGAGSALSVPVRRFRCSLPVEFSTLAAKLLRRSPHSLVILPLFMDDRGLISRAAEAGAEAKQ